MVKPPECSLDNGQYDYGRGTSITLGKRLREREGLLDFVVKGHLYSSIAGAIVETALITETLRRCPSYRIFFILFFLLFFSLLSFNISFLALA